MSRIKSLIFFIIVTLFVILYCAVVISGCKRRGDLSVNKITEKEQNVTIKELIGTRDIPVGVSLVKFKKENLTCLIHEASSGAGNITCDWTTYRNEETTEAF